MSSVSQCWVRGSSAAVGSSKSSTSGFMTSTEAIATRFFWPPESWNGARSASSAMSSIASTSSTRASVSSLAQPSCRRPKATSSRTVGGEDLRVGVLEDEADPGAEARGELLVLQGVLGDRLRRRRGRCRTSGKTSPSRTLSSVDLPQPLAPSSATFSPRCTSRRRRRAPGSGPGRSSSGRGTTKTRLTVVSGQGDGPSQITTAPTATAAERAQRRRGPRAANVRASSRRRGTRAPPSPWWTSSDRWFALPNRAPAEAADERPAPPCTCVRRRGCAPCGPRTCR